MRRRRGGTTTSSVAKRATGASFSWVPSPGWSLEPGDGEVTVQGGADHAFALVDLTEEAVTEVAGLWTGSGGPDALSSAGLEALDQLVLLGAVRPMPASPGQPLAVDVRFAGAAGGTLRAAIEAAVGDVEGVELASGAPAGLEVWVRTTATLAEAAAAAAVSGIGHLFVDVAYHHMVSLGPLVVPGETACLQCLAGRVSAHWGDPVPPQEPEAARLAPLVAGLVAIEVERVSGGICELANRTVTLDVERWRLIDETVLRLPWCPGCGDPVGDEP